jgi:superfamily II DNA or RNA helicase
MSGKLLSELGLPSINTTHDKALPAMLFTETHYDREQLQMGIAAKEPMLLPEQKLIYNEIFRSLQAEEEGLFFDAPGGTGKTFLLNLLLAKVRRDNGIAFAVTSSGYNCVF